MYAYQVNEHFDLRKDTVFAVCAVLPECTTEFFVPAPRDRSGVFFSLKCSLEACGQYLLERISDICISVSSFAREACAAVKNKLTTTTAHIINFRSKVSKNVFFCVFRK